MTPTAAILLCSIVEMAGADSVPTLTFLGVATVLMKPSPFYALPHPFFLEGTQTWKRFVFAGCLVEAWGFPTSLFNIMTFMSYSFMPTLWRDIK
jgi:hypothetical protein